MSFLQDLRDFFHPTEKGFFIGMVSGLVFNGILALAVHQHMRIHDAEVERNAAQANIEANAKADRAQRAIRTAFANREPWLFMDFGHGMILNNRDGIWGIQKLRGDNAKGPDDGRVFLDLDEALKALDSNGSMVRDGVLLTKVPQWRVDRTTQDDEIELYQSKIPTLVPMDLCLREFSTP